jgi:hypothetical protein
VIFARAQVAAVDRAYIRALLLPMTDGVTCSAFYRHVFSVEIAIAATTTTHSQTYFSSFVFSSRLYILLQCEKKLKRRRSKWI